MTGELEDVEIIAGTEQDVEVIAPNMDLSVNGEGLPVGFGTIILAYVDDGSIPLQTTYWINNEW